MLTMPHGYHAAVDLVATKGVPGDNTGKDLNQHVRRARWGFFVEGMCKDSGDSQARMLLDVFHGCDFGLDWRFALPLMGTRAAQRLPSEN